MKIYIKNCLSEKLDMIACPSPVPRLLDNTNTITNTNTNTNTNPNTNIHKKDLSEKLDMIA